MVLLEQLLARSIKRPPGTVIGMTEPKPSTLSLTPGFDADDFDILGQTFRKQSILHASRRVRGEAKDGWVPAEASIIRQRRANTMQIRCTIRRKAGTYDQYLTHREPLNRCHYAFLYFFVLTVPTFVEQIASTGRRHYEVPMSNGHIHRRKGWHSRLPRRHNS
jgi:hypothetical protein